MQPVPQPPELPPRAPLPDWWWQQTVQTRRLIVAAVLVVLVVLAGFAMSLVFGGGAGNATGLFPTEAEVFVAELSPERRATWDSLAECESGGDWTANTGNGYYGGLQISDVTWQGVGASGFPHNAPVEEQLYWADAIQQAQGWGAWPRCSERLGLRG